MDSLLLAHKYLLLKRIASGGMAEIFLAKQVGLDGFEKLVVVKRVLPQFATQPEYVRMFLDEARTAADLRHPNIVSTFEVDEERGTYFMVMEYLQGLDLRFIFRRLVERQESMPMALAIGIVMEVCAGLHYAHKKMDLKGRSLGVVHRDISPQNIVVTFDGETKIVDFGIAQAAHLDTKEWTYGVLKGKCAYMSPEQGLVQELNHLSDQFSLAVVLYELTTMQRLFRRKSQEESLAATIACEIESPSRKVPGYPLTLEAVLMKALAKNRDERFLNCGEFRAALSECLKVEGLVFSRDKLATYLTENFEEEHDPKVDVYGTYLSRQTHSGSAGKDDGSTVRSISLTMVGLGICALLLAVISFGVAFFYFGSDPDFERPRIPEVTDVTVIAPIELEQSLGRPEVFELQAKEKTQPQKKILGRLKIVVEPWGEVFVDGKRLGLTPLAPYKIEEGEHSIRILNPRFAQEKKLRVVIRANQDTLIRHRF